MQHKSRVLHSCLLFRSRALTLHTHAQGGCLQAAGEEAQDQGGDNMQSQVWKDQGQHGNAKLVQHKTSVVHS